MYQLNISQTKLYGFILLHMFMGNAIVYSGAITYMINGLSY